MSKVVELLFDSWTGLLYLFVILFMLSMGVLFVTLWYGGAGHGS